MIPISKPLPEPFSPVFGILELVRVVSGAVVACSVDVVTEASAIEPVVNSIEVVV